MASVESDSEGEALGNFFSDESDSEEHKTSIPRGLKRNRKSVSPSRASDPDEEGHHTGIFSTQEDVGSNSTGAGKKPPRRFSLVGRHLRERTKKDGDHKGKNPEVYFARGAIPLDAPVSGASTSSIGRSNQSQLDATESGKPGTGTVPVPVPEPLPPSPKGKDEAIDLPPPNPVPGEKRSRPGEFIHHPRSADFLTEEMIDKSEEEALERYYEEKMNRRASNQEEIYREFLKDPPNMEIYHIDPNNKPRFYRQVLSNVSSLLKESADRLQANVANHLASMEGGLEKEMLENAFREAFPEKREAYFAASAVKATKSPRSFERDDRSAASRGF